MNPSRVEQSVDLSASGMSTTATAQAVLEERRQGIVQRLRDGVSGAEIVAGFTDLIDEVLVCRYRNVVSRRGGGVAVGVQHCCLVAVGGYGRRELAPHSDIDVMMLYRTSGESVAEDLSTQVFTHLWDLGFQVGHSVRSIADCMVYAEENLQIKTSLMESRFLVGNPSVFQEFQQRFAKRVLGRRVEEFIREKLEERQQDYEKFGKTVFLLEPNIKKTKGGLRDLHLLQWVGMARYRATTLKDIANLGMLAYQEYMVLLEAREYLWKVRAYLHLQAGRAQEILLFDEQVRLAEAFGYRDQPHILAVEQFMQQYYRLTTEIHNCAMRFVGNARAVSFWTRVKSYWPSPLIDGLFRVCDGRLSIPGETLIQVLENPEHILRFFHLAQTQGLEIDGRVLEEMYCHMQDVPDRTFVTPGVSRRFRALLAGPGSVSGTLTLMHQALVLEKLVPAFSRVRGLMQFNQYHKYTVDEHSLLAVREVERLGTQPGVLGELYREIHQKDMLHLAVLLHDVGKGLPEDHAEVGQTIARDMASRLELDAQQSATLQFLVREHLLMARTAFRRDHHDEKVLLTFARHVGTPERLKHLLLLTVADIAAVGPGTLTKWKESLLLDLYARSIQRVSGQHGHVSSTIDLEHLADEILTRWTSHAQQGDGGAAASQGQALPSRAWIKGQLETFPVRYLAGTATDQMVVHLSAIQSLTPDSPVVESTFHAELQVCEYTFIAFDSVSSGIFMKITGVLIAKGLRILDAQIVTRPDGIVVDTFLVKDPDFEGPPTPARMRKVGDALVSVLKGDIPVEDFLAQNQRVPSRREGPLQPLRTEVNLYNDMSDQFTLIDVFADNRQGILHRIAKTVYELGLSIHVAKISTQLDQMVAVFHVTEQSGRKIKDARTCDTIQRTVYEEVERFVHAGKSDGALSGIRPGTGKVC